MKPAETEPLTWREIAQLVATLIAFVLAFAVYLVGICIRD